MTKTAWLFKMSMKALTSLMWSHEAFSDSFSRYLRGCPSPIAISWRSFLGPQADHATLAHDGAERPDQGSSGEDELDDFDPHGFLLLSAPTIHPAYDRLGGQTGTSMPGIRLVRGTG